MMTQLSTRRPQPRPRTPTTPKAAGSLRRPIDQHLSAELFKALSDPTRLRLLACLAKCSRPCSVSEIADCCSVDLSVVSRHLSVLERAGVLDAAKVGRVVSYSVRYTHLSGMLRALADALELCCPGSCPPSKDKQREKGGCCNA